MSRWQAAVGAQRRVCRGFAAVLEEALEEVRRSSGAERESALIALLQVVRRRGGVAGAPLELRHLEKALFGLRERMCGKDSEKESEEESDSECNKEGSDERNEENAKEIAKENATEGMERPGERQRESEGLLDWDSPTSEQVISELLCNGSFGGVFLFRRLGTLEGGRSGLLPSEALLLLGIGTESHGSIDGKLLAKAGEGRPGAVLLVYFLLSERYCGANNVWRALIAAPKAMERLLWGLKRCVERCAHVEVPQWLCGSGSGEGELSHSATAKFSLLLMKQILQQFDTHQQDSPTVSPPTEKEPMTDAEALHEKESLGESDSETETLSESERPVEKSEAPERDVQPAATAGLECGGAVAAARECVRQWASLAAPASPALAVSAAADPPLPAAIPPSTLDLLTSRLLALEDRLRQQEEASDAAAMSAASSPSLASSGAEGVALGDMGRGDRWAGIGHAASAGPAGYAVLQRDDGAFTMLNKAPGAGYLALSVGHEPKIFMDPAGCLGVGVATPRARLHVDGHIKCGSCYAVVSHESLTVVRGGFACRTLEPRAGPGYRVEQYDNGLFEVQFVPMPFSKRPSVIAVQHTPQEPPSLVPLGYVDSTKFGFYDVRNVADVWIEFFVFGPKLQ